MDPNFELLLILVGVAAVVGLVAAVALSKRVQEFGLIGTLRRALSVDRGPYNT